MLIIAIKQSSRPIFVPMFAILVATLIFGHPPLGLGLGLGQP